LPHYFVGLVAEALNSRRRPVNGSRVLVLGLAYKANVDDDRESPSYRLMDLLKGKGAEVAYYDPHVPVIRVTREHPHWAGTKSVAWNRETVKSFDVILISTAHRAVNYGELAEWAECIVDTRNAMAAFHEKYPGKIWKA